MSLAPNTRFGPYEIAEPIGSGGMGEVYRASDGALKRDVAIKVLPESFVDDPGRLARFQREAEVLASLNHYNIAQIYGVENSGGRTGLVMELVEGPTLADRLRQGPIELDEAIDIATQIASALEAAHDRGIIHRDLKPANVKLRPDGVVKVLDFGVAKAADPVTVGEGSEAPALTTPALTEAGMILGTAAYMSPEQARGKPVDKRADIWAFGVVLYEMLTGQPAFLGEDVTDTVASVLRSEPDWGALPALPTLLAIVLRQCLEKDRRNRMRDIADVRLALTNAYEPPRLGPAPAAVRAGPRRARLTAAAFSFLVLGALGAYWYTGAPAVGTEISFRQLTFRQGTIGMARFAPDGQVVVYGAAWGDEPYRLYTTRLDSFLSRPLDLPPADLHAVSGEGRLALALERQAVDGWFPRGQIAEVDLAGGAPRVFDDRVASADWGPDGELAAVVRFVDDGMQVEFPVGTVVHRTREVIGTVRLSPDGQQICFPAVWNELYTAERGQPARRIATDVPRIGTCAFSAGGDEVWFSHAPTGGTHSNLEAISLDGRQRRVLAALPVYARLLDVSPRGSVLLAMGALRFSVHGAASPDDPERDFSVFDASRILQLNGAGTHLLLRDNSTGARERGELFIRRTDDSEPIQLGDAAALALSPDGQWIAALGDGASWVGRSDRITLIPTGAGSPRTIELPVTVEYGSGNPLGTNSWEQRNPEYSADGNRLLLPFARDGDGIARAWVHDFAEDRTLPVTPEGVTGPVVLSPDGRFVAGQEADGVYVYSIDTNERRRLPGGPEPGLIARWSEDQQSLYVIEQVGTVADVYSRNIDTGERTQVRQIRVADPAAATRFDVWIARDGEAYAYTLDRAVSNVFLVDNVD